MMMSYVPVCGCDTACEYDISSRETLINLILGIWVSYIKLKNSIEFGGSQVHLGSLKVKQCLH